MPMNPSLTSLLNPRSQFGQMGHAAKGAAGIQPEQIAAAQPPIMGAPVQQTTLPTQAQMIAGGGPGGIGVGGVPGQMDPETLRYIQMIANADPQQILYVVSLIQDPEAQQDFLEAAMQVNPGVAQLLQQQMGPEMAAAQVAPVAQPPQLTASAMLGAQPGMV